MSKSWAPTSLPLALSARPVAVKADSPARLQAAELLGLALAWLAYTRLYFWLHPRQLTFDPSLFMYLTGKPDPTCGLTRTFAWMWRGDVDQAAAVYPLGPILFVATLGLVGYWTWMLFAGKSIRVRLSSRVQRRIAIVAVVALGLNWAAKLIWLGM